MSLSIEALNSTKELVATLADKGVSLTAENNSPIQESMGATKTWNNKISCLAEIDKLPGSLYECNDIRVVDGNVIDEPHSVFLAAASKEFGRALAVHVSYATSVVLPAVVELRDQLLAAQDLEEACGIRSYKVEEVSGSPLFDISSFISEVEKFGDLSPQREMDFMLDYASVTDEQLVGLLKTGSEAFDAAVDQFISNEGMDTIREVYRTVFQSDNNEVDNYDVFRADREKGPARNIATFLIALRLTHGGDGLPEKTGRNGLSLNKYDMVLRNVLEVSGSAIFHALQFQQTQDKQGKLIERVDGKTVYVNRAVYKRFMDENSGDVETILGSAISGGRVFYLDDILAQADKFKDAWTYHVANAKRNAASSLVIASRRVVCEYVRQYLISSEDDVIRANIDKINDFINGFATSIINKDLADVDDLALRALCFSLFSHTDAYVLLNGVTEAMASNPDITRDEALNLSVVNYVADWYASQINIAR